MEPRAHTLSSTHIHIDTHTYTHTHTLTYTHNIAATPAQTPPTKHRRTDKVTRNALCFEKVFFVRVPRGKAFC